MPLFALIPAAGSGTRLAGERPKQYAALAGKPMLWHAVRAICVPPVEHVFVVLAPQDRAFSRHDWSAFAGKLEPLYCGGGTRRDSVYNGLVAAMAAVDADDWMLVHDAARPCLPKKDLESLIRETEADEVGGILALPVAETVKAVAKDEAGAIEQMGLKPRLVAGSRENLKVTYAEDLAIAAAILARRR
ncbi:MAG: 2-C-methyl-D-erythritol 4-phosphate cytidylyltransferase [Betaproteobacteria bacterium]|nr:MAG: 2-C-methyl-D-erythritol 4-phosphate cytidylyltransferase [Betaproteobacteria bacterium]